MNLDEEAFLDSDLFAKKIVRNERKKNNWKKKTTEPQITENNEWYFLQKHPF